MRLKTWVMRVVATISMAIALVGCGLQEDITSGQIYSKTFEPAHLETIREPHYPMDFEHTEQIPDKWYIKFFHHKDGRIRARKVEVSKSVYDSVKLGDNFAAQEVK